MNDQISGLYQLLYSLSSLLGPIIGGALYDEFQYQSTMDISMVAIASIALLFFACNCGLNVFKNQRKFQSKLEGLKYLGKKIH
jgi:predicted MFS family arabinose efflux permease